MKSLISFFIFIILLSYLYSISTIEPSNYSSFIKKFMNDFNEENYNSIISYSSKPYLDDVSPNETREFLGFIKSFGKVKNIRFLRFDEKNSAVYLAELETTWFYIIVRLDESNFISSLVIMDPNYNDVYPPINSSTLMLLPFKGKWYVLWGGDSDSLNYHVSSPSQKNAFDFLIRHK